jgi:hypothetical protein
MDITEITDQPVRYHVSLTHAERDLFSIALSLLEEKFTEIDHHTYIEVGPVEACRTYTYHQVAKLYERVTTKLYPEEDDPSS